MRINDQTQIRYHTNVYLNDKKEPNAVEVYVPGNSLEGRGYVVRAVMDGKKRVATSDLKQPIPAGRYDYQGALCEKVFGQVRIEIEDDISLFEDK